MSVLANRGNMMNQEPVQVPTSAPQPPVTPPAQPPVPPAPSTQSTSNGLAIASLVLGILGLFGGFIVVGGVLGLIAIILGAIALSKKQSKGMSITGVVTGALAILTSVIVLFVGIIAYNGLQGRIKDEQRERDVKRIYGMVLSEATMNKGAVPDPATFVANFDDSTFSIKLAASGEPTTGTAVFSTGKDCDGTAGENAYAITVKLEKGTTYCSGS